jgi:hypothetical protein
MREHFLSWAMAYDREEDVVRQCSVKSMVLPDLTMSLKRILRGNQTRLEKTWLFDYTCWIQSVTIVVFINRVNQFFNTYFMTTKKTKVEGCVVNFSVLTIGRYLKLPIEGIMEGQLPALTKNQHESIFLSVPILRRQWCGR